MMKAAKLCPQAIMLPVDFDEVPPLLAHLQRA